MASYTHGVSKLIGKAIAIAVVAVATAWSGVVVLLGPHAYNDYLNVPLGLGLIAMGVLFAGYGLLVIGGDLADQRNANAKARLHLTPRAGDYTVPPAWGMGQVGRPDTKMMVTEPGGKGGVKVMSVKASNVDAVIFVVGLLIWTAAALYWFAPK
jgi:hypothetical protein